MARYKNTSADALSEDHLYAYDYRGAKDRQAARKLRRRGEGLGTDPVGSGPEDGLEASLATSPEDSRGRREDRSAGQDKAKAIAREEERKGRRRAQQLATDGKLQRLIDNDGYAPTSGNNPSEVKRMLNKYLQRAEESEKPKRKQGAVQAARRRSSV